MLLQVGCPFLPPQTRLVSVGTFRTLNLAQATYLWFRYIKLFSWCNLLKSIWFFSLLLLNFFLIPSTSFDKIALLEVIFIKHFLGLFNQVFIHLDVLFFLNFLVLHFYNFCLALSSLSFMSSTSFTYYFLFLLFYTFTAFLHYQNWIIFYLFFLVFVILSF